MHICNTWSLACTSLLQGCSVAIPEKATVVIGDYGVERRHFAQFEAWFCWATFQASEY